MKGCMVTLKVAVVHEWLVDYSGSERVLEQILNIFPNADLFSIVDFVPESQRHYLASKPVNTSFIQKLPRARRSYRNYLPLMPLAVEQFDLSSYNLIISSSHAVAKGILTGPDQLHLCYCHSPIRYAWDLQHQYLEESNLNRGLKSLLVRYLLHRLRLWDYRTANGVDAFIANSQFIAKRIWKVYRREATVIYPPVDTTAFEFKEDKEDFYFTASRFVPYKKISLIIEAFAGMPHKKLVVIGDGPDYEKVGQQATANITLLGYQPFSVLKDYMQRARAFVFAAKEDFGIVPVEAQACGTPVIAYGEGGVLETVRGLHKDSPTGVLFEEQTVSSLQSAVMTFEQNLHRFSPSAIRQNALRFSAERFKQEFSTFVEEQWRAFTLGQHNI
jgi:glycosyltransferase involved in cell wall biosynthesis